LISVVIPTLNAQATLTPTLAALAPAAIDGLVKEVIIADGGSTDATELIADDAGAQFVKAKKGRGPQLIAGAAAARGAALLFLHADTVLAPSWARAAHAFLTGPRGEHSAAAFRFAFDDDQFGARVVAFWVGVRCAVARLPYGDQGLLLRRTVYESIGGYRPFPLMEDVDIVRRLGRKRLVMLKAEAVTSAAKYRRDGYQKRAWRNLFLLARYYLGESPHSLLQRYD
jgi:rSAM/selenodomain-associated transferase 2